MRFKRDQDHELRLVCTQCNNKGKMIGDISSRVAQCTNMFCKNVWDAYSGSFEKEWIEAHGNTI